VLALSFATYGLMKNKVRMPALESLGVEAVLLTLPALVVVAGITSRGEGTFGGDHLRVSLLLVSLGVVTAVPLLLFGAAASRVPLSSMGLMQYITPTLQFLIGLLVRHESMSTGRWVGFLVVWGALAVFSTDALRAAHGRRISEAEAAPPGPPPPRPLIME
jgi:chloramphenicol-sensitive protein RarD